MSIDEIIVILIFIAFCVGGGLLIKMADRAQKRREQSQNLKDKK